MPMNNYDEDMRNEIMDSIENLALMVNREFMAIREDMHAQAEQLRLEVREQNDALRLEMKEQNDALRLEMKEQNDALRSEIKDVIREQIQDLRQETKAGFAAISGIITNHEYRIERVEKKLEM